MPATIDVNPVPKYRFILEKFIHASKFKHKWKGKEIHKVNKLAITY